MADDKMNIAHHELHEVASDKIANYEEAELAEALRNYQPGTDVEKKLVRKIDMRYVYCKLRLLL